MIRYSSSEQVDVNQYDYYLRNRGWILYDRKKLSDICERLSAESGVYQLMAQDIMLQNSGCKICTMSKQGIIQFLTRYMRCPEHYFQKRGVDGFSIDKKKCLEPLFQNGYATEFLEYYLTHVSLKHCVSSVKKILNSCATECAVNEHGTSLCKIPFNVNQQVNLRFNYSNFDIISQIPKRSTSCISVEEGYLLAWGDFAQSDFRVAYNLFLRSSENDAIMNKYDDKYEALARIVHKELGKEFNLEQFKEERKLYKTMTLATMYGTRNSMRNDEREFINSFAAFLEKCPKYAEYYKRIEDSYDLGKPLCITSYWSNEQICPIGYSKNSTLYEALNKPIQTGTSELVILTVNKILDMFYSRGYNEDDISCYFTRHDEPVFRLKKSVMKDSWIFKQFDKIFVDDWTPLSITFDFGYNYGVSDKDLTAQYESSIAANKDNITIIEPTSSKENTYYPIEAVKKIQVFYVFVGDITIITIYYPELNQVQNLIANTVNEQEVHDVIRSTINQLQVKQHVSGILVDTYGMDETCFTASNVFIKYRTVRIVELWNTEHLCNYAVCCYCKSKGIESPVNPPSIEDEEFIKSVTKFKGDF